MAWIELPGPEKLSINAATGEFYFSNPFVDQDKSRDDVPQTPYGALQKNKRFQVALKSHFNSPDSHNLKIDDAARRIQHFYRKYHRKRMLVPVSTIKENILPWEEEFEWTPQQSYNEKQISPIALALSSSFVEIARDDLITKQNSSPL